MRDRVLLVDDEPTICEVLQSVLEPRGFDTVAVGTCAAARAEARRGPFAAVLFDKKLPDGDGLELLEELRAELPDTALVIMTGDSSFETAVKAMRLGARDYLVKPLSALDEVPVRVRLAVDDLREDRKRVLLEAELRAGIAAARNELAAIFDAAAEPILIFDLSGRIRRHNTAASDLYRGLAIGGDLASLGDREAGEAIRRAAAGEPTRRERVVRDTTAGPITMTATMSPIRDHKGEVVALVETAVSIQETLRVQQVLHQADKMSTLGALAATLAHELANPIGCALSNMAILGGVDDAGRITSVDPAEAAEILSEVRASLDHSRDIIRRIREFAAPSPRRRSDVRITQVVEDAVRFVGPQLTHGAPLSVDVPERLEVFGERTALVQVVMNLLVNAAHALEGRPGGVTIRAREEGGEVVLAVDDAGCGIPETELPRIFDRFFTTKPAERGTGLGLAVCRDVVRSHGGTISVESQVGKGTRFEIRLPALRPSKPARVLVVDDDPMMLSALARQLRGQFDVCTATSAEEALALLADDGKGVQIVLSDFMMPGVNGAELLQKVRQRFPGMKRLVMTAYSDPSITSEIEEHAGPVDILTKPLNAMMLRTRLFSALA